MSRTTKTTHFDISYFNKIDECWEEFYYNAGKYSKLKDREKTLVNVNETAERFRNSHTHNPKLRITQRVVTTIVETKHLKPF